VTAAALEGVQAHVLRSARTDLKCSRFYFLRIDEAAAARHLLRGLLDRGMTLSDSESRRRASYPLDKPYVAVGFTRAGLDVLGCTYVPNEAQVPVDQVDPFCEGMAARRALLGDLDTTSWCAAGCNMLLWVADISNGPHLELVNKLLDRSGVPRLRVEEGSRDEGDPVVLGFRDATSQPFVSELAIKTERVAGGGTVTPDGWRPVPLGEFVLGSTDAGGEHLLPGPEWLTKGGTFVVYRKYLIDPKAFDDFLEGNAAVCDGLAGPDTGGRATLAAKILGRFRIGESPLGWPDGYDALIPPGTSPGTAPLGPNDFRYARDTLGYACPLGSHIRRANPRDALGLDGALTVRHRIIRRGVPWKDGDGKQGLHFICVNARISDQFEFIQRQWLNTGSALRLGDDVDLIAGSQPEPAEGSGEQGLRFVIQGPNPVVLRVPRPFSELQGGDYFLMPGVEGLNRLAGGAT
jgi:hypothetical protein